MGESSRRQGETAALGAAAVICCCCLVTSSQWESRLVQGGGGEGRASLLLGASGGRGVGGGGRKAAQEIQEALSEVKATIVKLEAGVGGGGVGGYRPSGLATTLSPGIVSVAPEENTAITEQDLVCYTEGDAFLRLVNSCCKTLYFGPGTDALLPMDLPDSPPEAPYTSGLPYGVRYRYVVGNRNDIVFNGGSQAAIDWINHYFGFNIKTIAATGFRGGGQPGFAKKSTTYVPDARLPPESEYEGIHKMPKEIPLYEGMTVVDPKSLPPGAEVIYDNMPTESRRNMLPAGFVEESPGFMIEYCEVRSEQLGEGIPMKAIPSDCAVVASRGIECSCGHIVFLGFTYAGAASNDMWANSVVFVDDEARAACGPAQGPEGTQPMPAPQTRTARGQRTCDDYHVTYDAASQHYYYDVQVAGGGRMRWIRQWCPSEWVPQEPFYRFQRYMPASQNNRPGTPINDFDFLDSYARDYFSRSRREVAGRMKNRPFDDWTLGNSNSKLQRGGLGQDRVVARRRGHSFDDWALGNSNSNSNSELQVGGVGGSRAHRR